MDSTPPESVPRVGTSAGVCDAWERQAQTPEHEQLKNMAKKLPNMKDIKEEDVAHLIDAVHCL